jgi:hypothetical protein
MNIRKLLVRATMQRAFELLLKQDYRFIKRTKAAGSEVEWHGPEQRYVSVYPIIFTCVQVHTVDSPSTPVDAAQTFAGVREHSKIKYHSNIQLLLNTYIECTTFGEFKLSG